MPIGVGLASSSHGGGDVALHEDDTKMAAMGMSTGMPWTRSDGFYAFVMWTVMMVGMMAGAAAPVLLLFAGARAR